MIGRFWCHRDVGELDGGGIRYGCHGFCRAPVEADIVSAHHDIGVKFRCGGCAPAQCNVRLAEVGSRWRVQHHRFRRAADHHVVEIPAVHDHGRVGGHAEADLEAALGGILSEVELFAPHRWQGAGVAGQRRWLPGGSAIGGNLHPPEIITTFQLVRMPEPNCRTADPAQIDGRSQGERAIGIVGVKCPRRVRDRMGGRGVAGGREAPVAAGLPLAEAGFEVVTGRDRGCEGDGTGRAAQERGDSRCRVFGFHGDLSPGVDFGTGFRHVPSSRDPCMTRAGTDSPMLTNSWCAVVPIAGERTSDHPTIRGGFAVRMLHMSLADQAINHGLKSSACCVLVSMARNWQTVKYRNGDPAVPNLQIPCPRTPPRSCRARCSCPSSW